MYGRNLFHSLSPIPVFLKSNANVVKIKIYTMLVCIAYFKNNMLKHISLFIRRSREIAV